MTEELRAPYPGYSLGALDAFGGYVSYRMLDETELATEIGEVCQLIEREAGKLVITQNPGLGMCFG
jgi:hypothetical protein